MPAARQIDREQVRMLVLQLGVRATARELDIPEGTVQYWSAEGKWLADTREKIIPASLPPPASLRPVTSSVSNPSSTSSTNPVSALSNRLKRDAASTRLGLSTAVRKASVTFARKKGDEIIEKSQDLRHIAAVASQVHDWNEGKAGGFTLNLGIAIGGMR